MAFTYFFRDMQTLELICDHVLPVLKTKQKINIWDAGCAMGPEPFSLSMLIRERTGYMYFRNVKITASDIDTSDTFSENIKNATYHKGMLERINEDYFHKYFKKSEHDDHYKLDEEIRKSVGFVKHDLLSLKPVSKDYGLIICKNVLLHFSEKERISVIKMFHESLSDGGYLAMEQTQILPEEVSDLFVPVVSNAKIFKKKG